MQFFRRSPPPAPASAVPITPAAFQKRLGRDAATGLPNQDCFADLLTRQCELACLLENRVSILVVEWMPDSPPKPQEEGALLAGLARQLRAALSRNYDVLARLDCGRFAILLPFTDAIGAHEVARRLHGLFDPAKGEAEPAGDDWDDEPSAIPLAERMSQAQGWAEPPRTFGQAAPSASSWETPADPLAGRLAIGVTLFPGVGDICANTLLAAAHEACNSAHMDGGNKTTRRDRPRAATPLPGEV